MRVQGLSVEEFCHPGVLAWLVEQDGDTITGKKPEYHLKVARDSETICCLVMIPQEDNAVQLLNRYICSDADAYTIDEKLLCCAEKWARQNGFKSMVIHSCTQAVSMYERLKYHADGEWFSEQGVLHRKMVKEL